MRKEALLLILCAVILGITFNVPHIAGQTTPRMYVDSYPPSGSGDIADESLRPGEIPISGVSIINSYPTSHYSGYGWINSFPSSHSTNGTVTDPTYAYDKNDATAAYYNISANPAYPQFTSFELGGFNVSGTYTIVEVDFRMNYEVSIINQSMYRILFYVGTKYQILQDWTTAGKLRGLVTWSNQLEPNDGTWDLTDIGNIDLFAEARKSEFYLENETGGYMKIYEAQVYFTVTPALSGLVTDPTYAYDQDQMTATTIDVNKNLYPGFSWFEVKDFNVSIANPYYFLGIDISINYTFIHDPAFKAEYRITLYVGDAYSFLQPWTFLMRSLGVRTWQNWAEPNDNVWNWTDISNIRIRVETRKKASAVSGIFMMYESSVSVPVDRVVISVAVENAVDLWSWQFFLNWTGGLFDVTNVREGPFLKIGGSTYFVAKKYNGPTGNYTLVSCTLKAPATVGMDGNGTLAYIEFLVEDCGSTDLQLYDTQMSDSFLNPIAHTTTDGYFRNTIPGDLDYDGYVGPIDLSMFTAAYGKHEGDALYNPDADLDPPGNPDGYIGPIDLSYFTAQYGKHI